MEDQNTPIPPQNIITQQASTPLVVENSNKSFWKTIGIGMSIVSFCTAIALVGYFVVLSKNKSIEVSSLTKTVAAPTPTLDPVANLEKNRDSQVSPNDRYIVELKSSLSESAKVIEDMTTKYGLTNVQAFQSISGFTANIPSNKVVEIKADARVSSIEQDEVIQVSPGM